MEIPEHKTIIVKEPFASQMIDALERSKCGNYTEEELKQIERSKQILSEYEAIWV